MNLAVIIIGIETIILLAVLIGAAVNRSARDDAWRRIADARRINAQIRADRGPCAGCPWGRRELPS